MTETFLSDFPLWALLPKRETGVTSFLNKFPEYDGRGTVIAILDSGVDPGAAGLQVTSDGKPKVIERIDCSGAGDVDTSTVVEAKNGEIAGLTGRRLKVPKDWKNPTGKFHIGVKNAFELYPSKLRERIEKERKEKLWDEGHKTCQAEAARKLQEFEAKNPQPTGNDKLMKEELDARVDFLNGLEKKYCDLGPAYDCVVFHDGEMWRACIDTSENGDLENSPFLGPYRCTRDFAPLTKSDQLHISVNFHDEGNTLEIVSMCSSHGTHVASIAAAYCPENPEKNGVAPGAQIVSLTIGDNRLGSMETGTALVRAMTRIMNGQERKDQNDDGWDGHIDVINMSYGEHAHWSNSGRIGELMNEVINRYGVIWVASAGNHGPALCTIGTPPDISTNAVIGVGAYVSPDMMVAEYSLRERLPGAPYTWTSRGPTVDGDFGVSICAPGGAIASVPSFTLRGTQLMNGTSMAAPHVCGAIAVLLSGMKAQKLPFSPYSVKRAIEVTAQHLANVDEFAQGHGLLQVERAFEHLTSYADQDERDVRFQFSCGGSNKGIHLRTGLQTHAKEVNITVEPIFLHHKETDPERKIKFNLKLSLSCSALWVNYPSHFDLMYMARPFAVKIDPTGLEPGVYTTSIKAYDVNCPQKGPLFEVPVTLVKPVAVIKHEVPPELQYKNVSFKPGTIKRHFIMVPEDATWAVLRLRTAQHDKNSRFVLHCVQLRPQLVCKTLEFNKMVNLAQQLETVQGFPVKGGLVLEVVVAKWWASLGDVSLDYTIAFYGLKPELPMVSMHGADGILHLEVRSGLRHEEMAPSVHLKTQVQVLRPTEGKVYALGARDVIPPARQIYELQLSYSFHISKATEVTPNSTLLSDLLYESEFESQLWMLFDANKQLISTGDAYPCKYMVKVEKGDFVLRMHVRHERRELLDRLTDLTLLLSQKLPSQLSLDIYTSHAQAMIGGKKAQPMALPPGTMQPIYIAPLSNEKVTKGATIGQFLSGTISYAKDEIGKKVDVYPFRYIMPPEPPKKAAAAAAAGKGSGNSATGGGSPPPAEGSSPSPASENSCNGKEKEKEKDKDKDKERSKWDDYQEAVRDTKITWLSKLIGIRPEISAQSQSLYEELCSAYPDHLPVHVARLQCLDASLNERVGNGVTAAHKVTLTCSLLSVADTIIAAVDQEKLLAYYGIKTDQRPDSAKIKSQMDKQKFALIEALARKGGNLCDIYLNQKEAEEPSSEEQAVSPNVSVSSTGDSEVALPTPTIEDIDNIMRDILKYVDNTDAKVIQFSALHAIVHGHFVRAIKLIQKQHDDRPKTKDVEDRIIRALRQLKWTHVANHKERSLPVRYPHAYHPF